MRTDYTHVSILIDRSGSMASIKNDVIGGFNHFIEEQKKVPGKLTVTLVQFDENHGQLDYGVVNNFVDVDSVVRLNENNFVPRGMTPLLDAAARLINETGTRLASMAEDDRPSKVVVLMITDGVENASQIHTRTSLKALIEQQTKQYNWQFVYIGANQDSFKEAETIGTRGVNFKADTAGVHAAFAANTNTMSNYRSGNASNYVVTQDEVDAEDKKLRTSTNSN